MRAKFKTRCFQQDDQLHNLASKVLAQSLPDTGIIFIDVNENKADTEK